MYVAAAPVSSVTVHNESVTSTTFTLTWIEISLTSSNFRHYRVFYLPVRGPYGPIMASNRRKRQSVQAGELTMNFTGTTGTMTNLYGAVTYRIQVAVVTTFDGQEVIGDRSAAIEMNTLEGGKKIYWLWENHHLCTKINIYKNYQSVISTEDLKLQACNCHISIKS